MLRYHSKTKKLTYQSKSFAKFSRRVSAASLGVLFITALASTYASAQSTSQVYLDPYKSHIRIKNVGIDAEAKQINLPLGKSVIVTVPRDVRDVLVSGPETVDAILRGPRTVYLTGSTAGDTSVFFFDRKGRQMLVLDARVSKDLTELRQVLRKAINNSSIKIDSLGEGVVLTGQVSSAVEAETVQKLVENYIGSSDKVVNGMTVAGGQQVLLRVKIAEVSRTTVRQLGIGGLLNQAAIGVYNIAASVPRLYSANGGFGGGTSATISGPANGGTWQGTIEALERSGIFRTLAEPNLTALSGQDAEFLAGGEFPFPIAGVDGSFSVSFKPYGVSLAFRPVVLSDGKISLKLGTSVSDISLVNSTTVGNNDVQSTIPSIRIRKASTTVEVPSGSSIMMAGLLQDRLRQSLDGVPWLKDIPVLGALFRSRDYIDEATELVVIVSPLIVEANNDDQIASPTDNYSPSDEFTALFLGDLHNAYRPPLESVGTYDGEVGFILE